MQLRKAPTSGASHTGPLRSQARNPGVSGTIQDELFAQNLRARVDLVYEFLPSALQAPWTLRDVSAAGTPTAAFTADVANGVYGVAHDATAEAQVIGVDWNDQLHVAADKAPFFQARVKITGYAANHRFIFGLASDYNVAFDSITRGVWFRIEGNDASIYLEGDDGTTDTDDTDSGEDITADTYVDLAIDMSDLSAVRFWVNDRMVGTVNVSAMGANTLQPVLYAQKDSGAGTNGFSVDYARISWNRR